MKLTIDQDRARLDARPTPRLLAVLPRLEGHRAWTKDGKLSLVNSRHNVDVLREALPALIVEGHENGHSLAEEFSAPLAAYEPRTQPYDHQAVALAKARRCSAFALFMEQGTGKTWVAITRAGELMGGIRPRPGGDEEEPGVRQIRRAHDRDAEYRSASADC